jgi:putative component of membrane protein insertase Oxa1/YidC/SpoIIIJ protein YidD
MVRMHNKISVKLSVPNTLNTASRKLVVNLIRGYQQFISPRKGFSCAHRMLYGGESCSQYFKRVVSEDGVLIAISSAKNRFQECRDANRNLKLRMTKYKSQRNYYASQINLDPIQAGGGKPREDKAEKTDSGSDCCDGFYCL